MYSQISSLQRSAPVGTDDRACSILVLHQVDVRLGDVVGAHRLAQRGLLDSHLAQHGGVLAPDLRLGGTGGYEVDAAGCQVQRQVPRQCSEIMADLQTQ